MITHTKPDGDAIGSLIAMRLTLQELGINATALVFDPVPDRYVFMDRYGPLPILGRDIDLGDLTGTDGVIVLDTCAYTQLEPLADWFRSATIPKLAVDHHITRDQLADVYLIDEAAAATCLILYDWARAVHWPINADIATALFAGIATDTGWFRHSNTDVRVLAAASDLLDRGVRPHELYEELYLRETTARFRLRAAACKRLELLADDRLAVITLPAHIFAECDAVLADTEDLVNEPLRIGSVVVSVMLVEEHEGIIRVGFRSKDPSEPHPEPQASACADIPDVDVAAIAQAFGGGGHRRAAGARVAGTLSEVRDTVVQNIERALGGP